MIVPMKCQVHNTCIQCRSILVSERMLRGFHVVIFAGAMLSNCNYFFLKTCTYCASSLVQSSLLKTHFLGIHIYSKYTNS